MTRVPPGPPPRPARAPRGARARPRAGARTGASDALATAIGDWLGHLRVERGLALNTSRSYARDLARYREHLAGHGIDDPLAVPPAHGSGFVVAPGAGRGGRAPLAPTSAARGRRPSTV